MELFRKFFTTRKVPDRLLEISNCIYVFDCCFSTESMGEDEYPDYLSGIVAQLQEIFPDASFMVSNFWSGDKRSRVSDILSKYHMKVMDYPQRYEGCPLLQLEMIHHFLISCENWLSAEGQHNMLLMHCDRGGWPVLAFMLAGLLLYRKTYTGEQETLEMVYKQARRDFIQQFFPLNPQPSHLRYLHYITSQRNGLEWPPISRTLVLDSVTLCGIPRFDAGEGYLRVHGQDSSPGNKSAKVLFETTKEHLRRYGQERDLMSINPSCCVQGDVVLEFIHIDDNLEKKDTMFRVMFNTTFIRSNVLFLSRDDIDVSWNMYDQFPRDFRVEVFFSNTDLFELSFTTMKVDREHESSGAQKQTFMPPPPPPPPPRFDIFGNILPPPPRRNDNMVTMPPPPPPPPRSIHSHKKAPKMDGQPSKHDNLEVVLQDQSAKPCDLRLQYLMDITNNFSDEQILGKGGFGVVYKGELPNGAMIAVKNIITSTEDVLGKQFKNEVDNLMKVKHQNVVRFVGYCYEAWMKYAEDNVTPNFVETPRRLLCFEYMPNGSLDGHITEESCGLDWEKRYEIIKGICCGLNYLHDECLINGSVIHLDLKPENVLLDVNMVPKIADFGLSRLFNDQKTRTYAALRPGTICYMAPEYLFQGTITTKADIYSLGVVIIQVVSGRKIIPYAPGNFGIDFELVLTNWRNRLEASPSCTSLETYCKQIQDCVEIGLSCVNRDPGKRPSIKKIIERLDK